MKKVLALATTAFVAIALSVAGVALPATADDATTPAVSADTSTSTTTDTTAPAAPAAAAPAPADSTPADSTPADSTPAAPAADPAPPAVPAAAASILLKTDVADPQSPPALPCLPNSAVSYTYDPVSNSGVITVTADDATTNLLCHPFWVTATSWKFTSSEAWPQARDVVDALPQISTPGSYPYAATVTCGQGDIYYSQTASPTPGLIQTSPSQPFQEYFLQDYYFNQPYPTSTLQDTSCWHPTVIPGDPTVTPQVCTDGVDVGGTITVALDTRLIYSLTGPDGATIAIPANGIATDLPAGLYHVGVIAAPGFSLDPTVQNTWPLPIKVDGAGCQPPTLATWPAGATGSAAVCDADGLPTGTISLLHNLGQEGKVDYTITTVGVPDSTVDVGSTVSSVSVAPGTYLVHASPAVAGDGIQGETDFTVTIAAPAEDCTPTFAALTADATSAAATCQATDGTAGVINLDRSFPGLVDYTITNDATNVTTDLGTTRSSISVEAGNYTVVASAVNAGDTILNNAPFHLSVASVLAICDPLSRLAFTGVDPQGGIILGAILLFLGFGALVVRNRRRVNASK